MSYGDFIEHEMKLSRDVVRYADPLVSTGDYGVSCDGISAYAAKLVGLPGDAKNDVGSGDVFAFPGGNAATLRHIVKALIPDAITSARSFNDVCNAPIDFAALDRPGRTRIRLGATAVAVRHDGAPDTAPSVSVTYAANGTLRRVRGRAVVVAIGGRIAAIVLNRCGHAYIAPQPGFYFGDATNPAPLEVIRKCYGQIAFGHSELSGRQSWDRAATKSRRALAEVLEFT